MSRPTPNEDEQMMIRLVAREALSLALRPAEWARWEDFLNIGEQDWEKVVAAIDLILAQLRPDPTLYKVAYRWLSERAEKGEQ